jgi:hypothetical protein
MSAYRSRPKVRSCRLGDVDGAAAGSHKYCLRRLEMSLVLPFRNVTHQRLGSGGGRARSPHTAQSPAAGRGAGRAASSLFSECALAREARRIRSKRNG